MSELGETPSYDGGDRSPSNNVLKVDESDADAPNLELRTTDEIEDQPEAPLATQPAANVTIQDENDQSGHKTADETLPASESLSTSSAKVTNGNPRRLDPDNSKEENAMDIQDTGTPFDWNEFQQRYVKAMQDKSLEEADIHREIERLILYHSIWAQSATHMDENRSMDRIRDRMIYVRHKEQELQRRLKHHEEVMQAFKSALGLLNSP